MNAAPLLDYYDRIVDGPGATRRLREFMRDLAVRGKLVAQDPNEEPALELLKKLPEARERLLRQGKASRSLTNPWRIPDDQGDERLGWVTVEGAELFATRSGNSKLIKGKLPSQPADGLYPGYSAAGQDVWLNNHDHEGTAIILSAVGARCGKAFLAKGRWSAIANTHIVWLMKDITYPPFAMLHLNNEHFWQRSGGAQPFIKVGDTLARPFSLPPFAEQIRIVEKFDELMKLCDQLEAAWSKREAGRDRLTAALFARLIGENADTFADDALFALSNLELVTTRTDQLQQFRATVLGLAVRGKLVHQDPTDEPVANLLDSLGKSRSNGGAFEIPQSWAWVDVGTVANARLGKMLDRAKNKGKPKRYLRNINVRWFGFDLTDLLEMPFEERELEEFRLEDGDVLICEGGEPGRAAVWRKNADDIYFQKAIHRVRFEDFVNSDFFALAVRASVDDGRLAESFTGTGIKHLTGRSLNAYKFPLPPLMEQHRIATKVGKLMGLLDQLEASLVHQAQTRAELLRATLHHALEPA